MAKSRFSTNALTKKYSRWGVDSFRTGYKSSQSKYSNSSFWMDDDFLDTAQERGRAVDYVKLAGYKRAIGNFVRIVTGKDDIKVNYSSGNDSYTDGTTVVISSKLDEKEFDSTVGLALHEGSHIKLTDFNILKNQLNSNSPEMSALWQWHRDTFSEDVQTYAIAAKVKDLVNIIEDRRIDRFVYTSAPGYQGYYKALYAKYFNAKEIDQALVQGLKSESTWDDYIFHVCNFVNPKRTLDALPALRSVWEKIDISNIARLKSTTEVYNLSEEVYKMIMLAIGGAEEDAKKAQDKKKGDDGEGEDGEGMPGGGTGDQSEPNLDGGLPGDGAGEADDDDKAPLTPKEQAAADKFKKALEKAIQAQKDFLNGNITKKKMSAKDAAKINAASESSMTYEAVGGDVPNNAGGVLEGKKTNCMVVKGFSQKLIDANMLDRHITSNGYRQTKKDDAVWIQEGIQLGTLLGKRLKTRDEERSLKTTRMETGRMDRRLIAELGFGNDRVFTQTAYNTVTPSLIHISLDASGSMSGKKWKSAIKTATAIAKACSMVQSMHCIISLRGCYEGAGYNAGSPLMWQLFDSRVDNFNVIPNKFHLLDCNASTPEGLCFEAIMKDVINTAQGKDMYFINVSDGEPGYSNQDINYGNDYAVEHTRAQVNKMRANGIKVLSYFVSEGGSEWGHGRSKKSFERMYGTGSEFIDTNNLNQLSRSINKLFERQQ
jgi:hypothetical protein